MKLICYFDGGYKCSKREMSWAFVIKDENGTTIEEQTGKLKRKVSTSNLAEFIALLFLIKKIDERKYEITEVEIYGDCKNVIDQMNGKARLKAPHLKKIFTECQEKIIQNAFPKVTFTWISRKSNDQCDRLMR